MPPLMGRETVSYARGSKRVHAQKDANSAFVETDGNQGSISMFAPRGLLDAGSRIQNRYVEYVGSCSDCVGAWHEMWLFGTEIWVVGTGVGCLAPAVRQSTSW